MIKKSEPLSLAEVKESLKKLPESDKEKRVESYIKKFSKISNPDALKLKKGLQESFPNLSIEQIIKIIDLLPKDAEDVRKVLAEAGIEENETAKILEIVKGYI